MDFGFEQGARRADRFESDVKHSFDGVETEIRELRSDMKAGFDSLHRLMIQCFAGTLGSVVAGGVILFLSHS
jgi:hypothetical protein